MSRKSKKTRKSKKKALYISLGVCALLIVAGGAYAGAFSDLSTDSIKNFFTADAPADSGRPYDANIAKDSEAIMSDKDALYSYVRKYGSKASVQQLHALSAKFGSCHNAAHDAGRFSFELYGEKAFRECGAECHSGCYHGATEAYFKKHGTANLQQNLNVLCSSDLNPFFSHQCLHGIGHGLMAWTSYDLPEALKSCDLLDHGLDSCHTGVFMENIVGSLVEGEKPSDPSLDAGHYTKYLSQDPQYPCNDPNLEEKYRNSCYFLQTSRMIQLFKGDFSKVAETCAKAPELYRRTCFESMGRDVGGFHPNNPRASINECSYAPQGMMREGCIAGAVQDSFWDAAGQDAALRFCRLVSEPGEKSACYGIIFGRAPQVLGSASAVRSFCEKAESEYRNRCLAYAR